MSSVSRRAILKSIGLIGLSGAIRPGLPVLAQGNSDLPAMQPRWQGQPIGRVSSAYMNGRAEPTTDADIIQELRQNDIVRVRKVVTGQTVYLHNDQWLETEYGYLYSSFVQPMWYHLPNPVQTDLGEGKWAEVTVPFTDAYWDPDELIGDRWVDTLYYGAVFRITDVRSGSDGKAWYKIQELYQSYYARATHFRIIPEDEYTPLSPDVPASEKTIDVDLARQIVVAYEYGQPVFAHQISSGLRDHPTPTGIHYVHDKRISDRMVGGAAIDEDVGDRYNLGGVPFVCYFTDNWVALHGTYWHNDYGIPRSHGCVNLPSYASRFFWRWTTPISDPEKFFDRPTNRLDGTRIHVF